jgi:hypothetical protein
VPSGKNYIIKNIKGKDFIVVKNLEGQNKETLVNSILSDHEIKQYYTPKDFKIGSTVTIYGRRFLIYDCDNFTKAFFYQNFGITDFDTVEVKDKVKNLPKMVSTAGPI